MNWALIPAVSILSLITTPWFLAAQDKTQDDRGMKVYADQKCSICHAIDSKGNAKGKLDGVGSTLKPDEIRAWLIDPVAMAAKVKADRKPVMKSYDKLPKDDLDALVAYLSSLKK